MKTYTIAVIPGDGIGNEVVPEGLRVLEAAGAKFGLQFRFRHFNWSCESYKSTGRMMPEDGIARLRDHDAIFLGAVGYPGVPDHVSLWGLLIPIRREFDLSELSFLDSTGIAVLVTIARAAGNNGGGFTVRAVSTTARRVLELSGVAEKLNLLPGRP